MDSPFAKTSGVINDRFGTDNVTEARCNLLKHFVRSFRAKATNVDVGDTMRVLQAAIKWLHRRVWSRNSIWNGRVLLNEHLQMRRDGWRALSFGKNLTGWRRCAPSVEAVGRVVMSNTIGSTVATVAVLSHGSARHVMLVG